METCKLNLFIFFLVICGNLSAQEDTNSFSLNRKKTESETKYYRHEVNISRTGIFLRDNQWKDYEKKIWRSLAYEREHDNGFGWGESSSGTLISYYYHFNKYLAVGGVIAFTTYEESLSGDYKVPVQIPDYYWNYETNTENNRYMTEYISKHFSSGNIKANSIFLMPSVKIYCLNCKWCSLYIKMYAGLHFQRFSSDNEEIPLKSDEDFNENKTSFIFIATPFGWEVGKQKVRGFFEFGLGSNTNIQIGLTYRFGRMNP